MVFTKKEIKKFSFPGLVLAAYLISLSLGQLTRMQIPLAVGYLTVYLSDIFAIIFTVLVLTRQTVKKTFYENLELISFLLVAAFSFLVSQFLLPSILPGLAYLVRLTIYFLFWIACANFFKTQPLFDIRQKLVDSLLIVLSIAGIFGILQYIFFPDLRSLFYVGWDDHLNRLVGAFLDPGFTSLFLVFGFLISLLAYFQFKKKTYLLLITAFGCLIGLTYARAGFVALIGSLIYLLLKKKKYILLLASLVVIGGSIFLLPNKEGQGTNLLRRYSITLRLENYKETLNIFKENPLFGVGYNNLCIYKFRNLNYKDLDSHSCSGSDNGFLLLLATTGVVGLISFLHAVLKIIKNTEHTLLGEIFLICLLATAIHTQFVNSIFYPWTLGFLGILYGLSRKNAADQKQNLH